MIFKPLTTKALSKVTFANAFSLSSLRIVSLISVISTVPPAIELSYDTNDFIPVRLKIDYIFNKFNSLEWRQ